jgi:hypothetical protein
MTDIQERYEELKGLSGIAEKTTSNILSYHGKKIVYISIEVACYLVFLLFFGTAFFVIDAITLSLINSSDFDIEMILSFDEIQQLALAAKLFLLLLSLFPLLTGLILWRLRRKSRILYEVNKIASALIAAAVKKNLKKLD